MNCCRCGEMADAQDLKSWDLKKSCRFESGHRHHSSEHEWRRDAIHACVIPLLAMQVANPDIAFLVFKIVSRLGSLKN